jgi:hypothetical protein
VQREDEREPPVEPWFGSEVRLVRTLRGGAFEHLGAALAAAGDLDGDGLADIAWITDLLLEDLAGPRPSGSSGLCVSGIRSTRRLAILRGSLEEARLGGSQGQQLASLGDLDGDGRCELLASAVSSSGQAKVWIFSGATGRALRTWPEDEATPLPECGSRFARVGDLDRDGRSEFRVGSRLYSGETLERAAPTLRALLEPDESRAWVEARLCSPVLHALTLESGDPARPPNYFVVPDAGDDLWLPPEIRLREHPFLIVSGADARVLGSWVEEPLDFDRLDKRAIGDWDGDGIGELWVARVRTHWPARVDCVVRSGADAHVLATLLFPREDFGAQVCVVGDTDGDGSAELAVGAPDFDGYEHGAGAVFLFELVDPR